MCAFFSATHHWIRHLGKSRGIKVGRDHPISSNDITRLCQMPVPPAPPGDKWVSCFLPNTHWVTRGLVSDVLQSWSNPRLASPCPSVILRAKLSHTHSTILFCLAAVLLPYQKKWWYHPAMPGSGPLTSKKPPFSQDGSSNSDHSN